MQIALAELRASNAELVRSEREATERGEKLAGRNAELEQRVAAADEAVASTPEREQATVEAEIEKATAKLKEEKDRAKEDVGKIRRELLSQNQKQEEVRKQMTVLAAAKDAALANEQAANDTIEAERAASTAKVAEAREAGEAAAAQLRERLAASEARVAKAEAASALLAEREEMRLETQAAAAGEQGAALKELTKEAERLQLERSGLQEKLASVDAEKARLLAQLDSSEQERNEREEELLQQVELWETEATRLSGGAAEKDAIVAQMRAQTEQLYNELGALHQSAEDAQSQLSSRARKAEAEVVRLRLQMTQIEDSAEDSVAGHEEESARHLAELRSEISRLLVAESEAKALARASPPPSRPVCFCATSRSCASSRGCICFTILLTEALSTLHG